MISKLLTIVVAVLVVAAPADATFPGANGLIAFTRRAASGKFRVEVVRPDGSGVATIVDGGSSPAWSPDGRRLVFQRSVGSDIELLVVNADGTGLSRIKHRGRDDFLAAWSPDGRQIAFTSDRSDSGISKAAEIYVVKADGSGRRRITRNHVEDDSPAWSPDGKRIAFARVSSRGGIYSIAPNGKGLRRLTRNRYDGAPSWSADGRLIAFERFAGGDSDIWVMNADGSNAHVVVGGETSDYMPAWSPDGTMLTFSRDLETSDMYVADPEGGNIRPLVVDVDDTFGADWQPLR